MNRFESGEIDREHPFFHGATHVHAWIPSPGSHGGMRWLDLGGRNHASLEYQPTWVTRNGRHSLKLDGANQYAQAGVLPGLAGATRLTILAAGSRGAGVYWAVGDADSGNNATHLLIFSSDVLYFQFSDGSASYPNCPAPAPGQFSAAARFSGGESWPDNVRGSLNGISQSLSYAAIPPSSLNGTGNFTIGRETYTSRYTNGTIDHVIVIIGKCLSDQQIYSMHVEPEQVLRKRRRRTFGGLGEFAKIPVFAHHYRQQGVA